MTPSTGEDTRSSVSKPAATGVGIVGLDVTLDDRRYGEWFDFIVGIRPD
jgi:hypothetical protein